jgi:hypothetical protein
VRCVQDYELKEQALVAAQLQHTLDTITAAVPTTSIVSPPVKPLAVDRPFRAKEAWSKVG